MGEEERRIRRKRRENFQFKKSQGSKVARHCYVNVRDDSWILAQSEKFVNFNCVIINTYARVVKHLLIRTADRHLKLTRRTVSSACTQ